MIRVFSEDNFYNFFDQINLMRGGDQIGDD